MKPKITQILLLFSLFLLGCSKPTEFFIGKWQILNIIENGKSVELIDNWMHLKADGTFDSYDGELEKVENGSWSFDSKIDRLTIKGKGDSEDSSWSLKMMGDTLIFTSSSNLLSLKSVRFVE